MINKIVVTLIRIQIDKLTNKRKSVNIADNHKKKEEILTVATKNCEAGTIMRFLSYRFKLFLIKYYTFNEEEAEQLCYKLKLKIFPIYYKSTSEKVKKALEKSSGNGLYFIDQLRGVDKNFAELCFRLCQKPQNKVDLILLSQLTGITFVDKPPKTILYSMQVVLEKLESKNPSKINISWVFKNVRTEYNFLHSQLYNDQSKWGYFVELLPEKWKARWSGDSDYTFDEAIEAIVDILEENDPKEFGPWYIYQKNSSLYGYIWYNHKTPRSKKPDWDKVYLRLPEKWQNRFICPFNKNNLPFSKAIQKFTLLLEKHSPEIFGEFWLKKNEPRLWNYFINNYKRKDGEPNWQLIIDYLSDEWKRRWRDDYTHIYAIDSLVTILDENQPEEFSSPYIFKKDKILWGLLVATFKTAEGCADWRLIISFLDEKYQKRFKYPRRLWYFKPKEFYKDDGLEKRLKKCNLELSSLLSFNRSDREKRNSVCHKLIEEAQKGNLSALKILKEMIGLTVSCWIERNDELRLLTLDQEIVDNTIERTIFMCDFSSSYYTYIYSTLSYEAIRIRRQTGQILKLDSVRT